MNRRAFFFAIPAVAALVRPAAAGDPPPVQTTPGTYPTGQDLAAEIQRQQLQLAGTVLEGRVLMSCILDGEVVVDRFVVTRAVVGDHELLEACRPRPLRDGYIRIK